jgi:hypothetical protein
MRWLLDFFYCRSWKEFFALAVLASAAMIVFWAFAGVCVCDVRIVCYMV